MSSNHTYRSRDPAMFIGRMLSGAVGTSREVDRQSSQLQTPAIAPPTPAMSVRPRSPCNLTHVTRDWRNHVKAAGHYANTTTSAHPFQPCAPSHGSWNEPVTSSSHAAWGPVVMGVCRLAEVEIDLSN